MDTNIEDVIQHRMAYVVYVPEQGFIKNRRQDFTDEFAHARLYGRESQAKNSITATNLKGHVIPVKMTLDPRQIFTAVLKG